MSFVNFFQAFDAFIVLPPHVTLSDVTHEKFCSSCAVNASRSSSDTGYVSAKPSATFPAAFSQSYTFTRSSAMRMCWQSW